MSAIWITVTRHGQCDSCGTPYGEGDRVRWTGHEDCYLCARCCPEESAPGECPSCQLCPSCDAGLPMSCNCGAVCICPEPCGHPECSGRS